MRYLDVLLATSRGIRPFTIRITFVCPISGLIVYFRIETELLLFIATPDEEACYFRIGTLFLFYFFLLSFLINLAHIDID